MSHDYATLFTSARAWAAQLGAGDDAEDAAQEALLRLWRAEQRGQRYPDGAAFAAVHQGVRWTLRDWLARRRPVAPLDHRIAAPPPTEDAETLRTYLATTDAPEERVTLLAWAWGYRASEQRDAWPTLFASEHDVYRVRHRLQVRLRRKGDAA